MRKYKKWIPWLVVAMAFIATSLSYLDRQVLSVSIINIKNDFHITDVEYGFINMGFLISYCIMFTVGGVLIDRFGSRWGLGISVAVWSFATMLHSLANNALHLGIYRFILGIGEGGAFTGAIKAVTEWIPKKMQGLANGIAIGGSALGAVIAPPLCVYLNNIVGWRGIFIVTSVIGFIWVTGWFLIPKKANNSQVEPQPKIKEKSPALIEVLKIKEVWVFILLRFLLDPIFYFYMFWIPKYLNEVRGTSLELIGKYFWIPFLALGVSNMLGGLISDKILKKTNNINMSRKSVMGIGALLTLPALCVKFAPSVGVVILILSIVLFAHGLWITNYITSISDIFGKKITSTVIGLSGTAGALSSLIINPVIGLIIMDYSYDPMWIYSGAMYPVAFLFFIFLIPKIKAYEVLK